MPMLTNALNLRKGNALELDAFDWFTEIRHGHMGKWQYMEQLHPSDPVRGAALWDSWEKKSSDNNMLHRQSKIISEQLDDMITLTHPRNTLVDLGPGGVHAMSKNTLPFIEGYGDDLSIFVAIDMAKDASIGARNLVLNLQNSTECHAINDDFLKPTLNIPNKGSTVALMMGGTIGNFEAEQNTPHSIHLMARRIRELQHTLPTESIIFIGLESTQCPSLLYGDYDHPAHAEFEINIMHGIKRDLLPDEQGFTPDTWKYSMKWWPKAYQFCHLAEAIEDQSFRILGKDIFLPKGTKLVIDNSFKFPVPAMQLSAQLAKTRYIKPFSDADGRMIIHAIEL